MHTIKALFLPALLQFLAGFAEHASAANTVAANPSTYSINENAGQVGVIVNLTRDAGDQQTVTVNF